MNSFQQGARWLVEQRIVAAIAAVDVERAISRCGEIPWDYSQDRRRFRELTYGHTVMMGRKTYQSLPSRFRPLPGRRNVVVSRAGFECGDRGVQICRSPRSFIESFLSADPSQYSGELWIAGGQEIYEMTVQFWNRVELTIVPGLHQGDRFFPEFEERFNLIKREQVGEIAFCSYLASKCL